MLIFHTPWKHKKHKFFMFLAGIKRKIELKWVKQLQGRREQHNLMFLV